MIPPISLNHDRFERVCYDRPEYPIYIRRGLLSLYPDYRAPDHWHDDIELILILQGQMEYNVNGQITLLKKGEGIFVNSGQMHFGFSGDHCECDFLCILFHPILLCSIPPFENDFVHPLIQNKSLPYLILRPGISWQAQILSLIQQIYTERDLPGGSMRAFSSFARIWALLWENAPDGPSDENRQSQNLAIIKKMVEFIQENYTQKISLPEIAAAGAVGQSKGCKLFDRYFSQSPNIYLNRYRLEKSIELLKSTDLSVTEIALATGFSNGSYYAETFRKWLGKSPTAFRKKISEKKPIPGNK